MGGRCRRAVNLAGRIVLPAFVDCHTHLDKGHIWPRMPNPDGTFMPARLTASEVDRMAFWTATDVRRRMDFGLRCAYAHGTRAIRTHLDSISPQDEHLLGCLCRPAPSAGSAGSSCRRPRLSASKCCATGLKPASIANRVARAGGVSARSPTWHDLPALLDAMFADAAERGLDLDFHADETDDVNAVSLRLIAEAAIRNRVSGRILVGHCCSLARQPDAEVLKPSTLLRALAFRSSRCRCAISTFRTGGRTDDAALARRHLLVHEMKARGIPVSIASDNTRDPILRLWRSRHAGGLPRMATRILHLRPSRRRLAARGRRDAG
jgi:cytosine deaminase